MLVDVTNALVGAYAIASAGPSGNERARITTKLSDVRAMPRTSARNIGGAPRCPRTRADLDSYTDCDAPDGQGTVTVQFFVKPGVDDRTAAPQAPQAHGKTVQTLRPVRRYPNLYRPPAARRAPSRECLRRLSALALAHCRVNLQSHDPRPSNPSSTTDLRRRLSAASVRVFAGYSGCRA